MLKIAALKFMVAAHYISMNKSIYLNHARALRKRTYVSGEQSTRIYNICSRVVLMLT